MIFFIKNQQIGWLILAALMMVGCDRRPADAPETVAGASMPTEMIMAWDGVSMPPTNLVPLRSIQSLNQEVGRRATNVIVRVQGKVLDERLGEYLVITDGSGTMFVEARQHDLPEVNELAVAVGRLADDGASLKNAVVTSVSQTNLPGIGGAISNTRPATLPLLTQAWMVRDLPAEKAAWNFPVRLDAVVTVNTKTDSAMYVQDDSAGIYVLMDHAATNLNPGDQVVVEGVSDPGGFAPIVLGKKITPYGFGSLPNPRSATLFQLSTGQEGSQWIEVHGVVRSVTFTNGTAQLNLHDYNGAMLVNIPAPQAPDYLLDAVVRIQGACFSRSNSKRQFKQFEMVASSLASVHIEEPGTADPLNLPVQPIASLGQFHPRQTFRHRVNVAGVVTLVDAESFFLQDADEGVQIMARSEPALKPGDYVMAAGYPGFGSYGYRLNNALFKIISHRPMPEPRLLINKNGLQPEYNDCWVQTQARYLRQTQHGNGFVLTLQRDDKVFQANCRMPASDALQKIASGSLLKITGLYRILADEARVPTAFEFILISETDIQVMEKPTWWSLGHTLIVIGSLTALIGMASLWVVLLRRKVWQQTNSLRQSELKFRSLVEQSLVGVYIIQNGRFVYANPRMAEIFGYPPQELVATVKPTALIHPDDQALVQAQIQRRLADEISFSHHFFRGRRKDGVQIQVEVLGSRTDFGNQPAVLGMLLDVTERKLAQDKILAQAQMLELASDAIVTFDLADKIQFWNPGAQRIYGITAAAAAGGSAPEKMFIQPEEFQSAKEFLKSNQHWSGEFLHRNMQGEEITVQSRWTLVAESVDTPASILTINTDISQQKRLESQFLRSQRLESVGVLAGGIAHDLNNTLVPIMMSAHLLAIEPDSEDRSSLLESILTSSERAANLVKQILTFARGTDGRRSPVRLPQLLEELRKILSQTLPKSIVLHIQSPPQIPTVSADATQLHQILMNLCINARDAMPNGGELTIALSRAKLDANSITLSPEAKPGEYVIIGITDTGCGMTAEIRDRIFDPFFTTKEVGKGTGLGLSTTLGIVKSHGGFITVSSVPGRGASFQVYLPAQTEGQNVPAESRPDNFAEYHGQNELLLIVDDEISVSTVAQKTLQRFGYRIIIAGNGAEAIAHYRTSGKDIALVIMDMMMPVLDGPATIQMLAHTNPNIKIIACSGLINEESAKKIHPVVCGYVQKPYTMEQLLKTVHAVLHPPVVNSDLSVEL